MVMDKPTKRFGYEIRNADNKIEQSIGGFDTRTAAETAATVKREEIARRGWRMKVYITEAHAVS